MKKIPAGNKTLAKLNYYYKLNANKESADQARELYGRALMKIQK